MKTKYSILIVDDEPVNLTALTAILSNEYKVVATTHGKDVVNIMLKQKPDLVLLDVIMPDLDGYKIIKNIKSNKYINDIPIIFVTSLEKEGDEEFGLKLGAADYISKPLSKAIVLARISNHLELKHIRDLLENKNKSLEIELNQRVHENTILQEVSLTTLVGLVETRDSDTGNHILRTQYYCEAILKNINSEYKISHKIDNDLIAQISKASQLHDIGKIGIPDSILLKPGKLTSSEFEIMKDHCLIGSNAISNSIKQALSHVDGKKSDYISTLEFLELSKIISEFHHEKWDGSGYPKGLAGDSIPLPARVMAIADVFDALTSKRVYKDAADPLEAIDYINKQKGSHFDPELVDAFNNAHSLVLDIYKNYGA